MDFFIYFFFVFYRTYNDTEAPLRPETDDYDPHLHRNVPHPTT